jgi:hypothetical protein
MERIPAGRITFEDAQTQSQAHPIIEGPLAPVADFCRAGRISIVSLAQKFDDMRIPGGVESGQQNCLTL